MPLLAALCLCGPDLSAAPAPPNAFTVTPLAPDRYRVDLVLSAWDADFAKGGLMPVPAFRDAVREEPPLDPLAPGWATAIEVPVGRSAEVELLDVRSRLVALADEAPAPAVQPGAAPIEATLGIMGDRRFLRVTARPFLPEDERRSLRVYEHVVAEISLHDTDPVRMGIPDPAPQPRAVIPGAYPESPPRLPASIPPGIGAPSEFAVRRSVTNAQALKITVSRPGWYRVTGTELALAGWPSVSIDAGAMRLTTQDRVAPMARSVWGPMGATDWIAFYASAIDSAYTTQNVYWLAPGEPSPALPAVDATPKDGWGFVTTAVRRVDLVPTNLYLAAYQPLDESFNHWFVGRVQGGTTSNLAVATPDAVGGSTLSLAYAIRGFRDYRVFDPQFNGPDHRTILRVNGATVASRTYTGEVQVAGAAVADAAIIAGPLTTIQVVQEAPTGVLVASFATALIEEMHLAYPARLTASNLPCFFRVGPTQANVRVDGLATTNLVVLDVSDPVAAQRWTGLAFTNLPAGWRMTFAVSSATERCFGLFDAGSPALVDALAPVTFLDLGDTQRRADYLAIVPWAFQPAAYGWMKYRQRDGLEVQVATPEDIYNEFGYGLVDAAALRQYIGYAYHWYTPPRPAFALLVGKGSYDPTRRTGHLGPEILPAVQGYSVHARTALEQWFVTVDGVAVDGGPDRLPDLKLGRLPAAALEDVERYAAKLKAYETAPTNSSWFKTALLVADTNRENNVAVFKDFSQTNTLRHLTNGGFDAAFGIATAYISDKPPTQVRNEINGFIDTGGQLVNYMGHGGIFTWSDVVFGGVWNRDDASARNNTVFPIFTVFTCRSGAFHEPGTQSLMEAIVLSPACGSAGVGPTAVSLQSYAERLSDGFYQSLAGDPAARLGDAMAAGQLRLWLSAPFARELLFYSIFGDPALSLWGGGTP